MSVPRQTPRSADAFVREVEICPPLSPVVRTSRGPSWLARTRASALLAIGMTLLVGLSTARAASTTAVLDAGGKRVSSASYVIDGNLSSLGGIASVASPAVTARHGYAGQLYDVQSLDLSASPTNVNETGTSQLGVKAILDDSTFLSLSAANVAWRVVIGPIASISVNGLAITTNVYQDTAATVRADYQSKFGTLSLTVLNLGNDDFGLYARDSMDDAWQARYFGLNNTNAAPTADPDGDGQSNLFEYAAGTAPTNGFSLFRLSIAPVPTRPTWMQLTLSPCLSNRIYSVLFSTNLTLGGFAPLTSFSSSNSSTQLTLTDTNATNAARFYRAGITVPAP